MSGRAEIALGPPGRYRSVGSRGSRYSEMRCAAGGSRFAKTATTYRMRVPGPFVSLTAANLPCGGLGTSNGALESLRAGSGACCHRCTRTSPRAAANGPPTGQRTGLEVIHDKLPCSPRTAVSGWWPHPVRNRPRAADTISAPTTPALLRSRIARMCRPAPAGDASVDPLSRRRDRAEGVDRFVGISLIPLPHPVLLVCRMR
jgi:hypothetical protein